MPQIKLTYEIDDTHNVEDNLTTLCAAVDALDPALSAILKPRLTSWAAGEAVDLNAVWDALYAATAPQPPEEAEGAE